MIEPRRSSICPCGRMSAEVGISSSRRTTNSSCSRNSDSFNDLFDDDQKETEYCDICKLLAPQVAARNQLMSALRNFMKDDDERKPFQSSPGLNRKVLGTLSNNSPIKPRESNVLSFKSPKVSPMKKKRTIPQTHDENENLENITPQSQNEKERPNSPMKILLSEDPNDKSLLHDKETTETPLPTTNSFSPAAVPVEMDTNSHVEDETPNSDKRSSSITDFDQNTNLSFDIQEHSAEEPDDQRGGFYDILQDGILNGRIQIQVSGRKVTSSHVEYFLRVQVRIISFTLFLIQLTIDFSTRG